MRRKKRGQGGLFIYRWTTPRTQERAQQTWKYAAAGSVSMASWSRPTPVEQGLCGCRHGQASTRKQRLDPVTAGFPRHRLQRLINTRRHYSGGSSAGRFLVAADGASTGFWDADEVRMPGGEPHLVLRTVGALPDPVGQAEGHALTASLTEGVERMEAALCNTKLLGEAHRTCPKCLNTNARLT